MPVEFIKRLAHGPGAPASAREALDAALAEHVDDDVLAELRLLASELVTNAVRHGREKDGFVGFAVRLDRGTVRLEARDAGSGFEPPGPPADPASPDGWGLVVVDRLAHRWGVGGGSGTCVWAEMRLAPNVTSGTFAMSAMGAANV